MNGSVFGLVCQVSFLLLLFHPDSQAQNSQSLPDRLHDAATSTTLDAVGSAPFHLKLSVEIFPQEGRVADKGTVEIWWSGSSEQRIVYDLSQYRATEVYTSSGMLRSPNTPSPPYIIGHILQEVLHPVSTDVSTGDIRMETEKQSFGQINMDCISLRSSSSKPPELSKTTYCFENQSQLRAKLADPGQANLRQTLGKFGTKLVPLDLQYTFFNKAVAHAHIDVLQSRKEPYPESSDQTNVVLVPQPMQSLSAKEMNSRILHRPDPVGPDEAKYKHISGIVLLHIVVGIDGKVTRVSLIGSSNDLLSASTIKQVSQWVYKPYLINNVPTEVGTTMTFSQNFSPK